MKNKNTEKHYEMELHINCDIPFEFLNEIKQLEQSIVKFFEFLNLVNKKQMYYNNNNYWKSS